MGALALGLGGGTGIRGPIRNVGRLVHRGGCRERLARGMSGGEEWKLV